MRIAVIDTGTNSTRLLVAEVKNGQVSELKRLTTITRLGEKMGSGGHLQPAARERVEKCINNYAGQIEKLGADRVITLATSSVRAAIDGEEFLRKIARSRGYDWKLLSGEQEACLTYAGATLGVGHDDRVMLFDVGGGSTEIVSGINTEADFIRSLDIGCVRLTERFLYSDPVDNKELEDSAGFIESVLKRELDPGSGNKSDKTIAVAGTATSLAAIDLGLTAYDRKRVDGHVLPTGRIEELLHGLATMTLAEKLEIPTMEKGRADVIVAGTLILERLASYFGVTELQISERDILDGAALAAESGTI
ncbi:MAG: Ppx/GppA phosphatase family protein [Thermoleophilia bacterium]